MNDEKDSQYFVHERLVPKLIPWYNKQTLIDHIARYTFAASYITSGLKGLDAACGSGYGSKMLADAGASLMVGVDISKKSIQYAKKHYKSKNVIFKLGDVTALDEKDHSFDVVVSFETLEHLKYYKKFIKEVYRVLKKDGILIISTPNSMLNGEELNPYHVKEFSKSELKDLLAKHFKNVELYGQKPMHRQYLGFVNKITQVLPPGFIRWFFDTGFKVMFRGSKVTAIQHFRFGFEPAFYIAVCKK